jgi:photosystem II stability/assembly factor-like uncharacterized protein
MRPVVMALAVAAVLTPAARAGDLRNFDDAALHAVQFIDREEGWAVGDDGVVWHTINSGRDWERQTTQVRASLRSLHFLSPQVGWVVGREELPRGGSVGVLLFTADSGTTWRRILTNALPGLNKIRFVNAREGFVLGDGSDQYPTGLFKTSDGGRTWQPVKGPRTASWFDAAFQDGQTAALVGAWSRLAKLRRGQVSTSEVEALSGRTLRGVQLDGNRGLAVGEGGAVLFTTASGARWGYADLKLSPDVLADLDFHALHYGGDHVWVVGRPGSVILHTPDRGKSWELIKTGHPLPLNGVFFLDDQQGWAVGEVGTILTTADGGKTWKVQRRGGERAAALFVHAHAAGLPLETMSWLGGEEGYLTAALRVVGPDPGSAAWPRAVEAQRLAAAIRQAGGMAGEMLWQFPVARHAAQAGKEELLRTWNRLHGGRADRQLLRQFVLALRMWRPEVIITDHPDPQVTGSAAEALVAEAIHEAFTQAADPRAFPEQIERLGLEPWRVAKVYARWHVRKGAEVSLDATQICPHLETAPREFAASPMALLAETPPALPAQRFFHLLDSRIASAANHIHLMDGTALGRGGAARRNESAAADLAEDVQKSIRARRAFQMLTETPVSKLSDPAKTLAQMVPALAAMPEDQAGAAAFAIASRHARQGQWLLAREIFLLMVDRYPTHPRTADAYRWLIQHNTSSEARRRQELGQFLIVGQSAFRQPSQSPSGSFSGGGLVEDKKKIFLASQTETRQWYRGSLEFGNRLAALGSLYASDPAIQFCLQAARRQLGELESAQEWYKLFRDRYTDGPWREAAAAELWLANRTGRAPKPVAFCRQTAIRPFLDGQFDDPCWRGQMPIVLRNAVGDTVKDSSTEVWLAYDQDFLYLALRCRHAAERYVPPVKVRQRDADLRAYDRVSLLLNLDRNYSTYFHFQVDQRGCVFEDCWGDRTWDPRWFVACRSDRTGWNIEAAIPLVELTGDHVPLGSAWACNVVRTLPGRGVQAFSLPADVDPRPEGMGLVIFSQDPAHPENGPAAERMPIAKVP